MQHQENLLTRSLLVAGFCAVVMIPLMGYGCGPEWARWNAAQAVIAYEHGDIDGAIEQLKSAVEKSPRDPSLRLRLAEKLIESNQPFQAERVCDEVLRRFPDNDAALIHKTNSQQAQGDFKKALETFRQRAKARNWLIGDSFLKLNQRAYYRALAGTELNHAKKDVDTAMSMVAEKRLGSLDHSVSTIARSLVTSALIGRRVGMTDAAIQRLTPRIDRIRIDAHTANIALNKTVIRQISEQLPPASAAIESNNDLRAIIGGLEKTLALLLTTRALCYQDIGATDLSHQDRAEVRDLTLDADVIASKLPTETQSIAELLFSHMLLDTRGYITTLISQNGAAPKRGSSVASQRFEITQSLDDALIDLNQAIFAYQVFAKSLDSEVHNHTENIIDLAKAKPGVPKAKAILFYHRVLLLEKMGNRIAADRDRKTIRQLGFTPDWHLF